MGTFLEFDKDDSNKLHTIVGTFNLGPMPLATDPMAENLVDAPQPSGYGLSNDFSWITHNGHNLIWLPSKYRPSNESLFAMHGATLAIGCSSGHVIFLELSKECPVSGL
ncbi:unnamed protein product [Penicillium salamii]|nr:unnamed protein product [Penicillium salamii]